MDRFMDATVLNQNAASLTNSSICSDSCGSLNIDHAEPVRVARQALNRHNEPDGGGGGATSSWDVSVTADDSSEADTDDDASAMSLHCASKRMVTAIRKQLAQMKQLHQLLQQQHPVAHRRLDLARLNRSLADIRLASRRQQRHRRRASPSGAWVDFTVRVRRESADRLMRDFLVARQRLQAQAQTGAGGGGGGGKGTGKSGAAAASKGGNPYGPDCIDSWTRSCRISASRRCGLNDALRPLLCRLGVRPGEYYRVTVGAFAAEGGGGGDSGGSSARSGGASRPPQLCSLLDTAGSLADRRVTELFLNL